jgi:hypothetical protein
MLHLLPRPAMEAADEHEHHAHNMFRYRDRMYTACVGNDHITLNEFLCERTLYPGAQELHPSQFRHESLPVRWQTIADYLDVSQNHRIQPRRIREMPDQTFTGQIILIAPIKELPGNPVA